MSSETEQVRTVSPSPSPSPLSPPPSPSPSPQAHCSSSTCCCVSSRRCSCLLVCLTLTVTQMMRGRHCPSHAPVCCHGEHSASCQIGCRPSLPWLHPHRPYYHIWTSRNPQQALLLPPAIGMEWASPSKHSRSSAQTSSSAGVATSNGSSSTSPASSGSERTRRPPLFDPDPAHQVAMATEASRSTCTCSNE